MIYKLTVRKEAEHDIASLFDHYEDIRVGLGHDLLLCLEEVFSKIERNPLSYKKVYKQLRRTIVRRFPYRVFYFVVDTKVVVTAIFHAQKDPEAWQNRT
jgi:plasmid stabilization system protein ParE